MDRIVDTIAGTGVSRGSAALILGFLLTAYLGISVLMSWHRLRHIPPGTIVWIHPYTVQRDARSFTLPEVFWPERWLVASGHVRFQNARAPRGHDAILPGEFVHNEDAFIPFGHGPWNCVGRGLALQEVRTVVCALIQRFEFSLREGLQQTVAWH